MNQLKAIVFDYGNVLCQPQRESDVAQMCAVLGADAKAFHDGYWKHREEYDRHDLDAPGYWQSVARDAGVPVSHQQIDELTRIDSHSWSRPSDPVVAWAQRLPAQGVRTAILSNMPLAVKDYLIEHCRDWLTGFDHMIFSCDIRCIKPDAGIYLHCIELMQLPPESLLFIDDKKPNVDAAQKTGMHGMLFESIDQAAAHLDDRFGLSLHSVKSL